MGVLIAPSLLAADFADLGVDDVDDLGAIAGEAGIGVLRGSAVDVQQRGRRGRQVGRGAVHRFGSDGGLRQIGGGSLPYAKSVKAATVCAQIKAHFSREL